MPTGRPVTLLLAVACALGLATRLNGADPKPIRALLVVGGCCHDYEVQKHIISEGTAARAHIDWTVVHDGGTRTDSKIKLYESPDWSKGFDVVVHVARMREAKLSNRILHQPPSVRERRMDAGMLGVRVVWTKLGAAVGAGRGMPGGLGVQPSEAPGEGE